MKTFRFIMMSLLASLSVSSIVEARDNFVIVSGSANKELAKKVAKILKMELHPTKLSKFNDGEISLQFTKNLRGKDVYIIQPTAKSNGNSVNDSIMELYLLTRTLKRSSANSVTAVIPYFGYARQDRKTLPRVPISASDIAMMIENSGVNRVIAVDLHAGQIQGFFHNVPVDNLNASSAFADYIIGLGLKDIVIVSPDAGGVARARAFQTILKNGNVDSDFAMIVKEREKAGVVARVNLIGDVKGKNVVIVDDIVDTAGTLTAAAKSLKDAGAKKIYACIAHPILSGPAHDRIRNSVFEKVVVSDSIPITKENPKIVQVSLAPLLAEAIKRTDSGESVSSLFKDRLKG